MEEASLNQVKVKAFNKISVYPKHNVTVNSLKYNKTSQPLYINIWY